MKTVEAGHKGIRILRFPEVIRKTGLSRSELYNRQRSGDFPGRVPLGRRTVGFDESEVDDYLCGIIRRGREQPGDLLARATVHHKTSCATDGSELSSAQI